MTVAVVAEFEGELALERLPVRDARLRLDAGAPRSRVATADLRVPGSEIAVDGERNLGPPAERRVESRPQSFEQSQLGSVPNRIASWVGADGQVEPDDSAPRAKLLDGEAIELTTLEPNELLVRCAGGGRAISKAETGADACHPVLLAGADHVPASAPTTAICGALTSRHPRIMAIPASLPVVVRLVRLGEQRTNESPAIRRKVLLADQAAKEREFPAQVDGPDRWLVRLADHKRAARSGR